MAWVCGVFFLLGDLRRCAYPVRGDGANSASRGAARDRASSGTGAGSLAAPHCVRQQKLSVQSSQKAEGLGMQSCYGRNNQAALPRVRCRRAGGRARAGTARLGARSVPGGCGWGAAPGAALRAPFCQHAPRSYIGARSCGGQLWFPDNAVVSVEDAHFQSQPCICFSCGRSF